MVGPQAASDFVTMIQHQSPEFRRKVLPKLKANVDAGQADPGSYAMVLDRSQTDAGKKQMYGENLTCDNEHPELHIGPIEDEDHVNQRRAAIGLIRLELYAQLVVAMSPNICPAAPEGEVKKLPRWRHPPQRISSIDANQSECFPEVSIGSTRCFTARRSA